MSRSVELEGEKVGRKQVRQHIEEIYHAKTQEDLGRIAGAALLALTIKANFITDNPLGSTQSWRLGFFDGFMSRCDELRASR